MTYTELLSAVKYLSQCHTGGTAWLKEEKNVGYIVGSWGMVLPDDGTVSDEAISAVIADHIAYKLSKYHTLGVWRNDGKVYYDLGFHYYSMAVAMERARQNGELAIWSIHEAKEHSVELYFSNRAGVDTNTMANTAST